MTSFSSMMGFSTIATDREASTTSKQTNAIMSPLTLTDTDDDECEHDHPAPKIIIIKTNNGFEEEWNSGGVDAGVRDASAGSGSAAAAIASSPSIYSLNRRRINSRDIPRTYDGMFGGSDDLLPFECNRHPGTLTSQFVWFLLGTYVTLVFAVHVSVSMFWVAAIDGGDGDSRATIEAWTLTNAIHLGITVIYLHWLKGSLYDEQGEMNAMTLWEQLDATVDTRPVRRVLLVVPTLLTYAACHFADYGKFYCFINVVLWLIAMLPKLGFMNGVRIFGINRTAGIDDVEEVDEDDPNRRVAKSKLT